MLHRSHCHHFLPFFMPSRDSSKTHETTFSQHLLVIDFFTSFETGFLRCFISRSSRLTAQRKLLILEGSFRNGLGTNPRISLRDTHFGCTQGAVMDHVAWPADFLGDFSSTNWKENPPPNRNLFGFLLKIWILRFPRS